MAMALSLYQVEKQSEISHQTFVKLRFSRIKLEAFINLILQMHPTLVHSSDTLLAEKERN